MSVPRPRDLAPAAASAAVSVVVTTRGPSLALVRLLRSLGAARDLEHAELILGLNGGGDAAGVARLAERYVATPKVSVVEFPWVHPGAARNHLATLAVAPILLFLDDDVEVPRGLLSVVQAVFDDPDVVAAGGPNLTPASAAPFEHLVGRVLASRLGTGPVSQRYRAGRPGRGNERSLTLCNLAFRRDAFVGAWFDGGLACAEENDLLTRLGGARGRFEYRPELAVFHHRRESLRRHVRQIAKYGFGRGQLVVRRPAVRQVPFVLPTLALAGGAAGAFAAPWLAAAFLAAYVAVVGSASVAIGRRRAHHAFAVFAAVHVAYPAALAWGAAVEVAAARARHRERPGRFAGDSAKTFAALTLAVAIGVAGGIVVARAVGPSGRGMFEVGRSLAVMAGLPGGLALGRAAVFLRARDVLDRGALFGGVLVTLASGSLAGAALTGALVAGGWSSLDLRQAVLAGATVPLVAFSLQGHSALRGVGEDAWFRRLLAFRELPFLAVASAALAAGGGVTAVFAAWLVQWAASALVTAAILLRACGRPRLPRGALAQLLAFGAPQALLFLLIEAHVRVDIALLQAFRGSAAVGRYGTAVGVAGLLVYAGSATALALFPRTAAAAARDRGGGAERTAAAVRTLVGIAIPGAVLLWVIGPALIRLAFGGAFASAGAPLRALLVGAAALGAAVVLQDDLSGRGRVWLVLAVAAVALGLNVALNLVLVPRLGAVGAGASSSVTYSLAAAALVVVFSRTTGVRVRDCLVPRASDVRRLVGPRRSAAAVVPVEA